MKRSSFAFAALAVMEAFFQRSDFDVLGSIAMNCGQNISKTLEQESHMYAFDAERDSFPQSSLFLTRSIPANLLISLPYHLLLFDVE